MTEWSSVWVPDDSREPMFPSPDVLRFVPIGPDTAIPERFNFPVVEKRSGHQATVTVGVIDGRVEVLGVDVTAPDDKTRLDTEVVRSLMRQLHRLVTFYSKPFTVHYSGGDSPTASSMSVLRPMPAGKTVPIEPPGREQFAQLTTAQRRRRVTKSFLADVGRVYLASDRSVEIVRRHFFVGERQAFRYVRQAREAGFIPDEED